MSTRVFTLRLQPELFAALSALAAREDRTIAGVLRISARRYLESHGEGQSSVPFARAQDLNPPDRP